MINKMTIREENTKTRMLKKELKEHLTKIWIGCKIKHIDGDVFVSEEIIDKVWNIVANRLSSAYNRGYQAGKERGFYEAGMKYNQKE